MKKSLLMVTCIFVLIGVLSIGAMAAYYDPSVNGGSDPDPNDWTYYGNMTRGGMGSGQPVSLVGGQWAPSDTPPLLRTKSQSGGYAEFRSSLGESTEVVVGGRFRIQDINNITMWGNPILNLRSYGGPAISLAASDKDYASSGVGDRYWYTLNLWKVDNQFMNPETGVTGTNGPAMGVQMLPLSGSGPATVQNDPNYHTAWLYSNAATGRVKVIFDDQLVLDTTTTWVDPTSAGSAWGSFGSGTIYQHVAGGSGYREEIFWDWATTQTGTAGTPFATTVPEPGSLLALSSGLVGLVGFAIRRRK